MFNYECYKRKGTVLGTCIDGFLFGACCRLPKGDALEDIEKEISEEHVESNEQSDEITESPSKPDLSDLLSKSDLDKVSDNLSTTSTEASQIENDVENSFFLDSIEVPLEIDNNIPSIILGNGSVVSLESLSLKPDLYKPEKESSTSSLNPEGNNQLFTWFTIDKLFNSTTASSIPTSTVSELSESTFQSTSTVSSTSSSSTLQTGSTQDLPFLDDLFSFDDEFMSSTTKVTTTSTTSTTTTVATTTITTSTTTTTTTTTTTSTTTTTTSTTSSTTTTVSTTTTEIASTTKLATHPVWPDPFLDLASEDQGTLRFVSLKPHFRS